MFGEMVSWNDYSGPGTGTDQLEGQQALFQLAKALQAGQDVADPGVAPGVGFPLRVESLEETLRVTTYEMKEIVFWKDIPKLPARNTVEENNIVREWGQEAIPAFIAEGALPNETDTTYERQIDRVKYLGTVGRVTHQMTLVEPAHGSVIAQETTARTMYLLRQVEAGLFYGDETVDPLEWNGYEQKIRTLSPPSNIIDLRGAGLNEDNLSDGALIMRDSPNFGTATDLYLDPGVHADISKTFFPKARYQLLDAGQESRDLVGGLTARGYTSPAGYVRFRPDVFVDDDEASPLVGVGDPSKRPSPPTVTVALAAAPDAASKFGAGDAGDYRYTIVAVNQFGRSAAVTVTGSPVTVASGDGVTFSVSPGAIPGTSYRIYRTKTDGIAGSERFIQRIRNTASPQVITDLNARLPGTTKAFLFQLNLQAMSFKQLAPMIKVPLAILDLSIRWAMAIYGVPVLYAPGKILLYENVGRTPGSFS